SFWLTFNMSDDAARVQDVLTGLAYLRSKADSPVELIGLDKSAVWALFAAALTPGDFVFSPQLGSFSGKDDDFIRDFFVPGIQKAGGVEAALRILKSRNSQQAR